MTMITDNDIKVVNKLFSQITSVSVSDIDLISSFLKKDTYKKNETIQRLDNKDTRINLVVKGVVHSFTYIDGEVFTINIALSGMLFNSLDSYIYNLPTSDIQQAISDVDTLYLEKNDVETLILILQYETKTSNICNAVSITLLRRRRR